MDQIQETYWAWLCSCPFLYRTSIGALIRYFGSPQAVFEAQDSELKLWKRTLGQSSLKWFISLLHFREACTPQETAESLQKLNISFISRSHPLFPDKLLAIPDCPWGLFYRGHLPDPSLPSAAIVGARRCSNYGIQVASSISHDLTDCGFQIISGMAVGVDGTAQSECVSRGGSSFALLGCGIDICYPPEHSRLYRTLPENGGIISEFPPGTPPEKMHFPMRNRLIAGLSDAVIVVEAREKSGSLITADMALDQGKDVFAVPGRYNDRLSFGCNRLIEQGASIIVSAQSLLENLELSLGRKLIPALPHESDVRSAEENPPDKTSFPAPPCVFNSPSEEAGEETSDSCIPAFFSSLSPLQQTVYRALDLHGKSAENIALEAKLTISDTMSSLVSMQLNGQVRELSRCRYARVL